MHDEGSAWRGIASAAAQPSTVVTRVLSPDVLNMAVRAPIARGEIVPRIHMTADGVMLVPAETISVFGNDDTASWEYVLSLAGPSNSRTVMRARCRAVGPTRRDPAAEADAGTATEPRGHRLQAGCRAVGPDSTAAGAVPCRIAHRVAGRRGKAHGHSGGEAEARSTEIRSAGEGLAEADLSKARWSVAPPAPSALAR